MRIGVLGGGNLLKAMAIPYRETSVETPYGAPSDVLRVGHFRAIEIVTMLRHGQGHALPAHKVNFRANVAAMASAGIDVLFGVSVAGDLFGICSEGTIVLYDQILDFTHDRDVTYHDEAPVAHVNVTSPVCAGRTRWAADCLSREGLEPVHGGTMAVISGPRFATGAESQMLRMLGGNYVNMSAAPEAFLAREIGLCYVPLALVTDADNVAPDRLGLASITGAIQRQRDRIPNAFGVLLRALEKGGLPPCDRCTPPAPINLSHLQL